MIFVSWSLIIVSMKIAPGEPVPPGFEDEVKAVSQLQPTLDNCKRQALVAVEYVVELTNDSGREPSYLCVLCDKRGNSAATILSHLISYNHRLKFLVNTKTGFCLFVVELIFYCTCSSPNISMNLY